MEKASCGRCADFPKYLSVGQEPVSKSVLSEHVAGKEKAQISPWHIREPCDEMSRPMSRSAARLHRLKRKTPRKISTCLIEDPFKDVVVVSELSGFSTETRVRAAMGSRNLAPVVTGLSEVAEVGLESCRNEIPPSVTIKADVQSAFSGRTKAAMLTDERDASIFTNKRDTDRASGPEQSYSHPLEWPALTRKSKLVDPKLEYELVLNGSSSTLKCSQTERQRDELSLSVQKSLLEAIKASNPLFPVRRVFAMLLKKHTDDLQVSETTEKHISSTSLPNPVREKREHPYERGDPSSECKRQRCNLGIGETLLTDYCPSLVQQVRECQKSEAQPRRSRLSRTHRLKQQKGHMGLTPNTLNQPESPQACPVRTQIRLKRAHYIEDALWTEKYQPQHSSEIVDNSASVKKLHSWLKKWKLRADCEERRIEQERKLAENTNSNGSWDCGDFQGETGVAVEEDLCNTMLITGPPGVGKTASVYACSQELGFQVFEVNASSQRSGHHVLTQLREATQSHQVDMQEGSTLRPSYLSSCNNTTSTTSHPASSKVPFPKKVVSSSAKGRPPPRISRHKKGGGIEACVTLSNFFTKRSKPEIVTLDGPSLSTNHDEQQTNNVSSIKAGTMKEVQFSELSPENKGPPTSKPTKRTATSLILFEEVDVIFKDDAGFLTAIQTFMKTTKRPVILTTSDPYFRARLDGNFETALFKRPSVLNVCSYLQLLCLAENVKVGPEGMTSLVNQNKADIRQSVLQLQLWACSGGPAFATSCTQSMLGLNTGPIRDLQTTLCHTWAEPDIVNLTETLTESWRTGVALLHSNLELFLPLPAIRKASPVLSPQGVPPPRPQDETPPLDINPPIPLIQDQTSSLKVSSGSRLRRRNRVQTSDSGSDRHASFRTRNIDDRHPTNKAAGGPASRHLEAVADFMDLVSFIDASLSAPKAGPRGPEELVRTGAEVMDGTLDEMREEDGGTWGCESTVEIQAAVEVLGFQRCLDGLWNGWTRTPGLEGEKRGSAVEKPTLPVAPHRQGFGTCETTPCKPGVVQRRRDTTRTLLSSQALCTLGNKPAAVLDYLPVLRAICQSERTRERSRGNGRFLHYLRSIHFSLPKASLRLLAEDFP